jgi:hypothetical protein
MDVPILRFDRQTSPEPHSLPAAPRVSLEVARGRVRQKTRPVTRRVFLIGAASDCDLVLGDLSFPEAYAYLFVDGMEVTIRRLGSGPEMFVNGELLDSAELFHGDVVEMEPFALRVVIDDAPRCRCHDQDHHSGCRRHEVAESQIAIDEVRNLLLDIHRTLDAQPAPARLRACA